MNGGNQYICIMISILIGITMLVVGRFNMSGHPQRFTLDSVIHPLIPWDVRYRKVVLPRTTFPTIVFRSNMYIHVSTMDLPLFKFLDIIQKACGGVSPLLVIMTQMSTTTSALHGAVGCARRNVMNVLAVELFTLASRPPTDDSTISASAINRSLPSNITPTGYQNQV